MNAVDRAEVRFGSAIFLLAVTWTCARHTVHPAPRPWRAVAAVPVLGGRTRRLYPQKQKMTKRTHFAITPCPNTLLHGIMPMYYLIYDDSCDICTTAVHRISKLDRRGEVDLVPISEVSRLRGFDLPDESELNERIHLITPTGDIIAGADAIGYLAMVLPKTRLWGKLISLPVIRQAARFIYRIIARNRHRLSRWFRTGG
jgi:predicted DCC family thiol-disulfide oxidoreductase YuxK